MPPRRVIKKVSSPELKSESSLSSILSSEEEDEEEKEPLDLRSSPEANKSAQVAQGRKRKVERAAIPETNGKKLKISTVDEDTPDQVKATSSTIRKIRSTKKTKSRADGNTIEEKPTQTNALEIKPTPSAKKLKVAQTTVIEERSGTEKTSKEVRGAKKEVTIAKKIAKPIEDSAGKGKRHRKTKEEKEAEAMPLAARTNGLRMFIGAHVSCAKGACHTSI